MQCRKCGTNNTANRKYCGECGSALADPCPSCDFLNQPGSKFCGGCGAPVVADTALSGGALAALKKNIPKTLASRILQSRGALQGERKQVTVLFADIKDSTALIDNLDPERALERLEPVLKSLIDAVHRNEGIVNRVQGDGIMALFGAPIALEDHAMRACRAGLSMQDAVKAGLHNDINIRIGLNSGEVLVRSIDIDLSMNYDAVGSTVHLAARMEQSAKPGTIRLTAHTHRLAAGYIEVKPLGATAVKGFSDRIETFELTGLLAEQTRWHVRAARGLTRFVGRELEFATLRRTMDQAGSGYGQVVAVMGEAGIGKSRLAHELVHSDTSKDWTVLEAAAAPHSRNIAYFPVSKLIRSWFRIGARDSQKIIRGKVDKNINEMDNGLTSFLPAFYSLLDLTDCGDEWDRFDPFQRRRQIIDAFTAVILKKATIRPVLVVFDDLHWIDTETQSILDNLVNNLGAAKVLLLVTFRPEYQHNWNRNNYFIDIRLKPLPADEANQFLKSLLGGDTSLNQLKPLLIARAEGTPLFLEEMVRTLIETGALDGARGKYHLVKDLEEIEIPATVQAVLAARIDRLSPNHKSLLQLTAVTGRDVPVSLLRHLADLSEGELIADLSELQAADFLLQSKPKPNLEFTFKHDLAREVAYEGMLSEHRRAIHSRVVETIETRFAKRLEEYIDRLADHALGGELWDKALSYHVRACRKATLRSANREAITFFEHGLEVLEHIPASKPNKQAEIDLRLIANAALRWLGETDRMIENLRQAKKLAVAISDDRRLSSVDTQIATAYWMAGDHKRALKSGTQALATAKKIDHHPLQFAAGFNIGMAHHGFGDFRKSIQCHRSLLEHLAGDENKKRAGWAGYPIVFLHTFLASSYTELGAFSEARIHIDEGTQIASERNHPFSQATIGDFHGYFLICRGEVQNAAEVLEKALQMCRDHEISTLYQSVGWKLVISYARSNRLDRATAILRDIRDPTFYQRTGKYSWEGLSLAQGEVCLATGQYEEASVHAKRAESMAHRNNERAQRAYALKLIADIKSQRGKAFTSDAENGYRDALSLATNCHMLPLAAHCRRSLGDLFHGNNRAAEAREEYREAAKLYDELHLGNWSREVKTMLRKAGR